MPDTCVIRRKTGTVFNETTGKNEPAYDTTVYTGPCKVQEGGKVMAGEAVAGAREVVLLQLFLHLPFDTVVAVDDLAEVTASADPALVGRNLRVQNLMVGTHKTARRLPVEIQPG